MRLVSRRHYRHHEIKTSYCGGMYADISVDDSIVDVLYLADDNVTTGRELGKRAAQWIEGRGQDTIKELEAGYLR